MYYSTPSGGYGEASKLPAGASEITQAQYEALVAAAAAAQEQAAEDAVAAANAQWTLVHDALVAGGVTDPAAEILANVVGTKPAAG